MIGFRAVEQWDDGDADDDVGGSWGRDEQEPMPGRMMKLRVGVWVVMKTKPCLRNGKKDAGGGKTQDVGVHGNLKGFDIV